MPFSAMDWNQPTTSTKEGLGAADPGAALRVDKPDTINAAPAIPAATNGTAGLDSDLPLLTLDWRQAISVVPSLSNSCSCAVPSRSGTLKAMEGTMSTY